MKRKSGLIIALFLAAVTLLSGWSSPTSINGVTTSNAVQTAKVNPDANKMMATISKMIGGRQYGSDNEKKACEYLKTILKSYGYAPQVQAFQDKITTYDGETLDFRSQNLIVVKKNTAKISKGIIIICAHYDCGGDSQGANDDASGVSVVLETARLMNRLSSAYEIRFVLFGGEEFGLRGSQNYVKNLSDNDKKNIKAVIDLDCIAQKNNVNPKIFNMTGKENNATRLIKTTSGKQAPSVNKANKEISDYYVFEELGIPALCIGQPYDENLLINNSKDVISLIDKTKLLYVANIVMRALGH